MTLPTKTSTLFGTGSDFGASIVVDTLLINALLHAIAGTVKMSFEPAWVSPPTAFWSLSVQLNVLGIGFNSLTLYVPSLIGPS